ncbi:hypothetical protein EKD16_08295 [Streptomonospora litoralis]|uniref:Uncharacterized protein n=1 Tax=Streptomonospora litoralis TaxID=2498135 RepID=A0A4P6PZ89_9ACTN|nr:hypothetical protein EKD16_08295 [Streptomonospora litoralis]
MRLICTCGHPKSAHTRGEGPNSIGQFFFGQCAAGWKDIPPYLIAIPGHCPCGTYRPRWWWPWKRKNEKTHG